MKTLDQFLAEGKAALEAVAGGVSLEGVYILADHFGRASAWFLRTQFGPESVTGGKAVAMADQGLAALEAKLGRTAGGDEKRVYLEVFCRSFMAAR